MIIIRDFISRTARKDGRCEVCGWNIGKGEEYRVSHSFQYYIKMHQRCYKKQLKNEIKMVTKK